MFTVGGKGRVDWAPMPHRLYHLHTWMPLGKPHTALGHGAILIPFAFFFFRLFFWVGNWSKMLDGTQK